MNAMKKITILAPAYNEEESLPFLYERISKVMNSNLNYNFELLFVNDGSTDKTLEIIEEYGDKRIKIYSHQKKQDLQKIKKLRNFYLATSNFENALVRVQGDYIFLADQDDIWKNDKVIKTIKCLEK